MPYKYHSFGGLILVCHNRRMKTIMLTKGYVATIDDEDYERVSQFNWYALVAKHKDGSIKNVYAASHKPKATAYGNHTRYLHRFIMNLPSGRKPVVDHKDHDGLNNQKSNLRVCSQTQNLGNSRNIRKGKTSKFKGVSKTQRKKQPWLAQISLNGKVKNLGRFASEKSASEAYKLAAAKNFKEFAA